MWHAVIPAHRREWLVMLLDRINVKACFYENVYNRIHTMGSSINDTMLFWGIFYHPPPHVMLHFYASFKIVGHADPNPPPSGMTSFMDGPQIDGIRKSRECKTGGEKCGKPGLEASAHVLALTSFFSGCGQHGNSRLLKLIGRYEFGIGNAPFNGIKSHTQVY